MPSIVVHKRHQLPISRRIDLAYFVWALMVVVEELRDVAIVILSGYEPASNNNVWEELTLQSSISLTCLGDRRSI